VFFVCSDEAPEQIADTTTNINMIHIYIYIRGRPPLDKLIPVSTDGNLLRTLPADVNLKRSGKQKNWTGCPPIWKFTCMRKFDLWDHLRRLVYPLGTLLVTFQVHFNPFESYVEATWTPLW
jgi:hypothetical protein